MKTLGVIMVSLFAVLLMCSLAHHAAVKKVPDAEVFTAKSSPAHVIGQIGAHFPLPSSRITSQSYPFLGLIVFGVAGGVLITLSRHPRKVASTGPWDH